jgi:hypothetical protein
MDPIEARQAVDEALCYLGAAETALERACANLDGIPGDAAAHVHADVQFSIRKLKNIAALVRLPPAKPAPAVPRPRAAPAPSLDL